MTKPGTLPKRSQGDERLPRPSDPAATPTDQQTNLPETAPPQAAEPERTAAPVRDPAPRRANALEVLIEDERVELMQVFGILRCLYDVLLHADDDDSTLHADVAKVCARLINESVSRLEVLIKRYKAGEFRAASDDRIPSSVAEHSAASVDDMDEPTEGT